MNTVSASLSTPITLDAGGYGTYLTIFGTVNALGPAGTYAEGLETSLFQSAVFGPAIDDNSIFNLGLVAADSTAAQGDTADYGIVIGAAGTIRNAGTVTGPGGIALLGSVASYIQNSSLITGTTGYGVLLTSSDATLINTGTIFGNDAGIALLGGGVVNNATAAVLSSASGPGVDVSGAATIENAGTIAGGTYAILASGPLDLIAGSGAKFNGSVTDVSGNGTLDLASGGSTATYLDLGTSFSGFDAISFAPGAIWTLEGNSAALAAGQTISGFASSDGIDVLPPYPALDTPSFYSGDTIILDGFAASTDSFAFGIGLILSNATASETLAINSVTAGAKFVVATYGAGSTIVSVANTLVNYGVIDRPGTSPFIGAAVYVKAGYTLFNQGSIYCGAVYREDNVAFPFLIYSTGDGVQLVSSSGKFSDATPSLDNNGYIFGMSGGVSLLNGGNITNSGTIKGGDPQYEHRYYLNRFRYYGVNSDAIDNKSGPFTLTVEPGAVFDNPVVDDASTGVLIFAGSISSSLDIRDFTGFQNLDFSDGASWSLSLYAPYFGLTQTISGLNANDTINISNFRGAGTIELAGFAATASSYAPGTGLTLSNATVSRSLRFSGTYSNASFAVKENADGGTDVSVACFCRGTRIATPRGNILIQKLRPGDIVRTMHGWRPIKWIGHRAYSARFLADNPVCRPIRIRRNAISLNVPSRDVFVSPDHAIAEGGVLVHAHLLQNGISITRSEATGDVEYFHLELDTHTLIFAENLASESFIDEGARHRFTNAASGPASVPQRPCLPRVFDGFHLHNIKTRIARRAGIPDPAAAGPMRGCIDQSSPTLIRGWAQDVANPESPVPLEFFLDGISVSKTPGIFSALVLANVYRPDLRAAGIGSGCHGFSVTLPNLPGSVTVCRATDGARLASPRNRHHQAI